jgi:hypothetical protein
LFVRYWPEYEGKIYLNTENKTFSHPGLNIICTRVGTSGQFGKTFRAGLDKVDSDRLMLIMIDYLFLGSISAGKISEYYNYFVDQDLDSLCLVYQEYPNTKDSGHNDLNIVIPPAPHIMFSYQIAFWKKEMLYQMALPHENPWTSEWYGTLRAERMGIKLAAVADEKLNPVIYNMAGCLHRGKWLGDAITHLRSINYDLEFTKRGLYHEAPADLKSKLKVKWMIVKDGLRGSYLDLLKRKRLSVYYD